MKDAYYFPHDANAHNDPKILNLRLSCGWEGVGLYWTFLEILRDMPKYKYQEENHLASISLRLGTPQATLQTWLNQCYKVGLLVCDDGYIYSNSFLNRMNETDEKRRLLSEAGRRGGIASSQAQARLKPGSSSKVKESKVKESNKDNSDFELIIKHLNTKARKSYRLSPTTIKHLRGRVADGFNVDDFLKVIDTKTGEWVGTDFEKYLRPETLFGTKFEGYLNQKGKNSERPKTLVL